jgi:SAM-dependent methyltransferase
VFLMAHGTEAPSAWVQRWAQLIQPNSQVLDVACGRGRHMRFLASLGHRMTGIDRDPEAIAEFASLGEVVHADIENASWPLPERTFDAVIVTNYLWRPLMPQILASIAPEGVLIYETFAAGNETVGKPSRPDFLLHPGELLSHCQGLRIVAYEDGFLDQPVRFVQRIVAVKATQASGTPKRFHL